MTYLQSEYQHRLAAWSDIQEHMQTLFDITARYPQAQVLELGIRRGNSTISFLAACEQTGGHLFSIDLNPPDVPAEWAQTGKWTWVTADDMAIDLIGLDSIIPGEPTRFDVLFIDTSHDYQHTLAELAKYVPLVKPGGTVLLHDTNLREMEGLAPQGPYPVRRAARRYCAENSLQLALLDGDYGLGVIQLAPQQTSLVPSADAEKD